MQPPTELETNFGSRRSTTVSRNVLICIKCGSFQVYQEENDIACIDCGAILFYKNHGGLLG